MITFTPADADFEEFSLTPDGLFALPVSVRESSDGNVTITSYLLTRDITEAFVSEYKSDFFSTEARDALRSMLSPIMAKYGYSSAPETGDILLEFSTSEAANTSKVETVILHTNKDICTYEADTALWNLEVDDEDPMDVICAVTVNGRIAAYASVNDFSDGACEINVECAPAHRRRGYGSACAAGLAGYLLGETDVERVLYVCRDSNIASQRTAERAGFTLCGRSADFVFYR